MERRFIKVVITYKDVKEKETRENIYFKKELSIERRLKGTAEQQKDPKEIFTVIAKDGRSEDDPEYSYMARIADVVSSATKLKACSDCQFCVCCYMFQKDIINMKKSVVQYYFLEKEGYCKAAPMFLQKAKANIMNSVNHNFRIMSAKFFEIITVDGKDNFEELYTLNF